MRSIFLLLLLSVPVEAQTSKPADKMLQAYKLDLEARTTSLQKELLSGRLSKADKARRSAKLKELKGYLAGLAKGQVRAEPFADVATRDQSQEYVPQAGQVFALAPGDVQRQAGDDVRLRWSITMMVARNGRPVPQTEGFTIDVRIPGGFKPGVYYVVDSETLRRLEAKP